MSLIYNLDASSLASLWSNDAKTTQASDGSVVAVWTPSSGSVTTDAIQTSNTKRPLYRASYASSGYAAVEFDGSNDELQCAHSTSFSGSVYDLFVVLTPVAVAAGDKTIFSKVTNSSWNDGVSITHTGTSLRSGAPGYSEMSASNALAAGVKTLIAVKLKVSARTMIATRGDNLIVPVASTAATAVSTTSTSALFIGGNSSAGGGDYANIAVHEIRIYTGEESLDTRLSVQAELAKKWGLTTLSTVPSSGGVQTSRGMNGGMRS